MSSSSFAAFADEWEIKREKRAFIYINTAITIDRKSNRFTQLVESVNVFSFSIFHRQTETWPL